MAKKVQKKKKGILRHYASSGEDFEEERGSEPAANGGASPAPMEYGETHKSAVRL